MIMQLKIDGILSVEDFMATWQETFEIWLRLDGRKGSMKPLREKSIEAVLQDVRHFTRFINQYEPNAQPCSADPKSVKAYFDWQTGGAAPASVNRRLASLRTLMRWSLSVGLIDQDPTARIPRVEMSRMPPRARSNDDCKALAKISRQLSHLQKHTDQHKTLGMRDQVIWSLLKEAGLRREEVANVSIEGLDLGNNRMTITGKGAKVGEVYIKASLRKVIERWLKEMPVPVRDGQGTPLVVGWNGKRITAGQVARRLIMMCQAAGINATCHDWRHTFVYDLVESAMNSGATRQTAVGIACQQARHGDTRITEMYLRPSYDQVAQAMEGMR